MSKLDDIKETVTNKIDELRDEMRSDKTTQSSYEEGNAPFDEPAQEDSSVLSNVEENNVDEPAVDNSELNTVEDGDQDSVVVDDRSDAVEDDYTTSLNDELLNSASDEDTVSRDVEPLQNENTFEVDETIVQRDENDDRLDDLGDVDQNDVYTGLTDENDVESFDNDNVEDTKDVVNQDTGVLGTDYDVPETHLGDGSDDEPEVTDFDDRIQVVDVDDRVN